MGRYLDIARKFGAGMQTKRPVTPVVQPQPSPWLCEHCGNPAQIEDVCLSLDGTRRLTLWQCEPCQIWGVTPDTLRQPPVWVSKQEQ